MKRNIIWFIIGAVIIALGIYGVNQKLENQQYEKYLSAQTSNDFFSLTSAVLSNQKIYDEIVKTSSITAEQLYYVHERNYDIVRITQEYKNLAVDLERLENGQVRNLPANNAASMANYFRRLAEHFEAELGLESTNVLTSYFPSNLPQDEDFELKEESLQHIEMIRDINQVWVEVILNHVEGASESLRYDFEGYSDTYFEEAITMDYWVDIVLEMDQNTSDYLREQHLQDDIGYLLNSSPISNND